MQNQCYQINIKEGMPFVADAKRRLQNEIATARKCGYAVVKIIHGYGSTGCGGAIKRAIIPQLEYYKSIRFIAEYTAGESFGTFDAVSQKIFVLCPSIIKDHDYNRCNPGITIILLRH